MINNIFSAVIAGLLLASLLELINYLLKLRKGKGSEKNDKLNLKANKKIGILSILVKIIFAILFIFIFLFIKTKYYSQKTTNKTNITQIKNNNYIKTFKNLKETILKTKDRFESINKLHLIFYDSLTDQEKNKLIPDIYKYTKKIEDSLTVMEDDQLTWAYKEVKYDYLSYIYAIKAELTKDIENKNKFIIKSLEYNSDATQIYYLCEAMVKFTSPRDWNYDYKKLKNWFHKNKNYSRLLFIKAWLYAMMDRINLNNKGCVIAKYYWDKIDPNYKKDWPPDGNPSLNYCKEVNWEAQNK